MSEIRECLICGNKYKYCPHCNHDPSWKMIYDTEWCKQIGNVVSAYNMKMINKDKASSMLNGIAIKDFSNYKKEIAEVLQEIMTVSEVKPKRRRKRKK